MPTRWPVCLVLSMIVMTGMEARRENRLRLPLEVFQAVRKTVGKDYVVGTRFLADEVIRGGNRVDDAIYFGVEFARAGFDFLSLSKGGKFEDAQQPKVGQRGLSLYRAERL